MFFNWEFYVNKYDDLKEENINSEEKAYNHWIKYGKKEKRIYTDIPIYFDWIFYVINTDNLRDVIDCEDKAWKHYLYIGQYNNKYRKFTNIINKIYQLE
jgi:hypothetical protein